MHLEHFVSNASLKLLNCICCCIKDQWLLFNVYWLLWAIIRSQEQGWLAEQREIRNKNKKQKSWIAFNPTHLKTSSKFVIWTWIYVQELFLIKCYKKKLQDADKTLSNMQHCFFDVWISWGIYILSSCSSFSFLVF